VELLRFLSHCGALGLVSWAQVLGVLLRGELEGLVEGLFLDLGCCKALACDRVCLLLSEPLLGC
jgi:hypothetical protein